MESLVAERFQSASDSLPEEVLGIDGKLLEARCGEPLISPLVRLRWGRGRGRLHDS